MKRWPRHPLWAGGAVRTTGDSSGAPGLCDAGAAVGEGLAQPDADEDPVATTPSPQVSFLPSTPSGTSVRVVIAAI